MTRYQARMEKIINDFYALPEQYKRTTIEMYETINEIQKNKIRRHDEFQGMRKKFESSAKKRNY